MTWQTVPGRIFAAPSDDDGRYWLIKGVLPRRGTFVLYGPSGSGKSFLAIDFLQTIHRAQREENPEAYFLEEAADMAARIERNEARPLLWNGHRVKFAGPAVYVALEGSHGAKRRFQAYAKHFGTDELAHVSTSQTDLFGRNADELADEIIAWLKTMLTRPAVICFDTFARIIPGANENDAGDLSPVLNRLERIAKELDCLVGVIHHTGHAAKERARGSSAIEAAADTMIAVDNSNPLQRRAIVTKQKDGEAGLSFPFTLEHVALGVDEDGDAIGSCVVKYLDRSTTAPTRPEIRGKYAKAVWKAAQAACIESTDGTAGLLDVLTLAETQADASMRAEPRLARGLRDYGWRWLEAKRWLYLSPDGERVSLKPLSVEVEFDTHE